MILAENFIHVELNFENFYFLFFIGILTHLIRSIYEVLKDRKIISPDNKIVFTIIFADMALLWISWFKMCELDPLVLPLPYTTQVIGFIFSAIGLFVFFVVIFKLKTVENYKGDLITDGIFRYFRHPMYLAFIFWLFGYAIFKSAGISLLMAIPFTLNILFWRNNEEKDLKSRYPDYEEYKKKTYF